MLATSDPERGSDSAKAEIALPARVRSSQRCCSGVPNRLIAPVPSPCMAKAKSASPSCLRQRLAGDAQRAHIKRTRIAGVDRRRLQPAVAAQLCHQLAAGCVDVVMRDRQVGGAPGVQPSGEIAVAIVEEWPVEERAVGHQLPSNTGFPLATKAR